MFRVDGPGAQALFADEIGGHRWQRVPPTERNGKIQTSTVTVAVLPEPASCRINIAKLFGIYAGIPLAILVLTLASLGIKSFTDLSASIETRRKDISNSLDEARNQAKHLHDEGDALNLEYQKQRENLAKVESLSKDLKVLDNKVDNLAKKVGVNVSGSGLAPGEANAILLALDRFPRSR